MSYDCQLDYNVLVQTGCHLQPIHRSSITRQLYNKDMDYNQHVNLLFNYLVNVTYFVPRNTNNHCGFL